MNILKLTKLEKILQLRKAKNNEPLQRKESVVVFPANWTSKKNPNKQKSQELVVLIRKIKTVSEMYKIHSACDRLKKFKPAITRKIRSPLHGGISRFFKNPVTEF